MTSASALRFRGLLQAYLKEVGSELYREASKLPLVELGRQMNIVDGANAIVKPRNVGVLFFHDEPRKYVPGAQIDVVIFPKGPGGGELIEKAFHGPLHEQVRDPLRYLQSDVIREKVVKHRDRAEATRIFNYPFPALEEAVVNAVYHRSYEQREPVEVRVTLMGSRSSVIPARMPRSPRPLHHYEPRLRPSRTERDVLQVGPHFEP